MVGGIIPDADAAALREAGVAAVYTPKDWDLNRMMRDIVALVAERHGSTAPLQLDAASRRQRAGGTPARGDLHAAPAVLNLVESRTPEAREQTAELLAALSPAALGGEAPGHVVGVTGPPGVGKSSLLSRLVAEWRARGRSVAVLAVDPTSRRSGGALLGDRARIERDPADAAVFIRSTAAGERLGGLAPATRAAAGALAAAFDVVVIETVGVGQSETEVADVADTVAVSSSPAPATSCSSSRPGSWRSPTCWWSPRPTSGGSPPARWPTCAPRCARWASATPRCWPSPRSRPPRESTSSPMRSTRTATGLDLPARRLRSRRLHALADFVAEHGERGLRALGGRREAERWLAEQAPDADVATLAARLEARPGRIAS